MDPLAKMTEYEKIHSFMFPSGNVSVTDVVVKKTDIVKPVIEQTSSTVTVGADMTLPSNPPQLNRKQRRHMEKLQKTAKEKCKS